MREREREKKRAEREEREKREKREVKVSVESDRPTKNSMNR